MSARVKTDYQTLLSMRYAADILSLVYENERIMATDLLRIAKNYATVTKTANCLIDAGLMSFHLESGKRLMKIYTLTPKGEAIGKRMYEAREIVLDNMPFKEQAPVAVKEKKSKKKGKKSS